MRRTLIAACALAFVLAGCDRAVVDDEPGAAEATAIVSPTPEPTPCVLEDASRKARSSESSQPFSPVVDLRWDESMGCPRVVFEFRDHVPGYTVGFAEPPFFECGRGVEIDPDDWDASAYLSVRMEPSGGGDIETGDRTYEGPRDIDAGGDVLKHLTRICDFEATYEWIVGVDEKRPFNVSTFDDPSRLVIDISQG